MINVPYQSFQSSLNFLLLPLSRKFNDYCSSRSANSLIVSITMQVVRNRLKHDSPLVGISCNCKSDTVRIDDLLILYILVTAWLYNWPLKWLLVWVSYWAWVTFSMGFSDTFPTGISIATSYSQTSLSFQQCRLKDHLCNPAHLRKATSKRNLRADIMTD